jgi:hypothetical protein
VKVEHICYASTTTETLAAVMENLKKNLQMVFQVHESHIDYCGMSTESQNCETSRQPLIGNGSANTTVARQWLSSRHMMATTGMHATI